MLRGPPFSDPPHPPPPQPSLVRTILIPRKPALGMSISGVLWDVEANLGTQPTGKGKRKESQVFRTHNVLLIPNTGQSFWLNIGMYISMWFIFHI